MNPEYIFFGVILVVLVLFMFRNGRKRQRDAATLASTLKPGAEVMTTFGVYGHIESIDEDENKIVLRTSPAATITIHRQAVGRVVTPVVDDEQVLEEPSLNVSSGATLNGEPIETGSTPPAYGERIAGGSDVAPTAVPTPEEPTPAEARRAAAAKSKRAAE